MGKGMEAGKRPKQPKMGNAQQMAQMQAMQREMDKVQEEIEQMETTATSGGGAVTVTVTGKKEIKDIQIQPEVCDPDDVEILTDFANLDEAGLDVGEQRGAVHVVLDVRVDEQKQVGDLVVGRHAFSNGRDHDEAAVAVGLDDLLDATELVRRRNAGAAEFADLDHLSFLFFSMQAPQ